MKFDKKILEMNRRDLLYHSLKMTAAAGLGHITFPQILKAQESFPLQRKLIWINLRGGWDILEATDPKQNSTSGIDMIYSWNEAQTLAGSDVKIGRWLPEIASLGEDLLVVRGLAMGTTSHTAGSVYMDTGVLSNSGNVNAASIPAIVASQGTSTIPIIQLNGGSEPRTDRGLLNPVSVVRANNLRLYRSMYPEDAEETAKKLKIMEYIAKSATRLEANVGAHDRLSSMIAAEEKVRKQFEDNVGSKLAVSDEELAAFTTGAPAGTNNGVANSFALALKLISGGICDCVNLGMGGFDTHSNQSNALEPRLRSLDFLVKALVDGLKAAEKLDSTLIVIYSDFGRTPKVNNSNGRDHWPVGGAMMIGGGVQGGRAVGGTDDNLKSLWINPDTGAVVEEGASGAIQPNATHLGGSVLELTLGSEYMKYRDSYLTNVPAFTQLKK